ncbi:hypothetical protein N7504_006168 [Penicillium tannophilum]|nr:hypothetical protein N7504_006168 [Penicillium tannophilum]
MSHLPHHPRQPRVSHPSRISQIYLIMGEQGVPQKSNNNAPEKDDTPAPTDDKSAVRKEFRQPSTFWDCGRPGL